MRGAAGRPPERPAHLQAAPAARPLEPAARWNSSGRAGAGRPNSADGRRRDAGGGGVSLIGAASEAQPVPSLLLPLRAWQSGDGDFKTTTNAT